jgi:hypothetical protein
MTPLGYENLKFLYKCQLGLNRKNQQDLKLNLNPLEYGFYCSLNCRTLQNHCRNLIPRLRRKRGPRKTNNIELLLWSQRYECRRDHILNSRVWNMPTIEREPTDENKLQCGVSIDIHCLAKWMKDKALEVPYETTSTRIDDNQDARSALGRSKRYTSHLKS